MEMTGNVVIEKGTGLDNRVLSIVCPRCGAPKHNACNVDKNQICAERIVALFAKEAKPLAGPHGE